MHAPVVKVALLGGVGVGKSSLLSRITSGQWSEEAPQTNGVAFQMFQVNGNRIHVWDISGDPHFADISASSYLRAVNVVLLCYDTTRPSSLDEINAWAQRLKQSAPTGTQAVLCGTKHEAAIDEQLQQRAAALASALGIPLALTSAKNGTGVQEAFSMLVKAMRTQQDASSAVQPSLGELKPDEDDSKEDKGQPALDPMTESLQSIAARFSCPAVAATLSPCGAACAKLTRIASVEEATQRQPARDRHQAVEAALASTELSCEADRCEGGALHSLPKAPACKLILVR